MQNSWYSSTSTMYALLALISESLFININAVNASYMDGYWYINVSL